MRYLYIVIKNKNTMKTISIKINQTFELTFKVNCSYLLVGNCNWSIVDPENDEIVLSGYVYDNSFGIDHEAKKVEYFTDILVVKLKKILKKHGAKFV